MTNDTRVPGWGEEDSEEALAWLSREGCAGPAKWGAEAWSRLRRACVKRFRGKSIVLAALHTGP